MTSQRSTAKKRCVALIGYRGAGKTAVGRNLARILGGEHLDTDEFVVATGGKSIAEVFRDEGESGFRRKEAKAIADALASSPAVLSVGGGAVTDEANVARLRDAATVVWLTAPPEVLWQRIEADPLSAAQRPALSPESGLAEVREVLKSREPLYERAADIVVDTLDLSAAEVAGEIVRRLSPDRES